MTRSNLDAQACAIGHRRLKESDGTGFSLIPNHPAKGDAGRIVDADMDELRACVSAPKGDPSSNRAQTIEIVHVRSGAKLLFRAGRSLQRRQAAKSRARRKVGDALSSNPSNNPMKPGVQKAM
jgi:hypothetical protein